MTNETKRYSKKIVRVIDTALGSPYPYITVEREDGSHYQMDFEEFFNAMIEMINEPPKYA